MRRFLLSRQSLFWIFGGLLLGGIVHILVVLSTPRSIASTASQQLWAAVPVNEATVLPPVTADAQLFSYMAPDVRYVLCRYDISKDPVSVRTPLLDGSWSISLYDELGSNFYTITGSDLQRREAELILAPSEDGVTALPFGNDQPTTAITVSVPERTGLLVIRAPESAPGRRAEIDRALSQVTCGAKSRARNG
ncbi:MAG: DUF1254 domain-containing protein [Hyphomicrobiaceae bacterium]